MRILHTYLWNPLLHDHSPQHRLSEPKGFLHKTVESFPNKTVHTKEYVWNK